ncbi:AMP-binding protein [Streptomyces durocortorensis]|uniref:AMP-binding protein n=1 Tax=Streptomyces durocortorensis TaxID=2811104 RepID=A0ABS2HTT9_9ACTN|nr:AMP-binding protein [Streptomyces durocortorensis]MBM7053817.1 AMP-binding protein [Streptomyces durocortorensis]
MTRTGRHSETADSVLRWADKTPEAPALWWKGTTTSYRELADATADARARLDEHVPAGATVAVLDDKSPGTVATALACLATGRPALLPSPTLPPDQVTAVMAEAHCAYALAGTAITVTAPAHGGGAVPPGTALVLTTSGSTGIPKAVPLPHRAVDAFTDWAADAFGIAESTPVLNYAPLNFDLCLLDVWTTLAHGGQVVLVDPSTAASGRGLLRLLRTHRIEVVQAVPLCYALVGAQARVEGGGPLGSVRHAAFTGDVMPEQALADLAELMPGARLHNIYGCTETNDSLIHEVDRSLTQSAPMPLGRPLPGVRLRLRDPDGRVLNGPGSGELEVSTPFQSTGYADPSRAAEKFVLEAAADGGPGTWWFRTGDLVARDTDGALRLIGRLDHQVKIRGVAVNTGEVEQVLLEHPEVLEAGVTTVPDPVEGRRLIAVVRLEDCSTVTSLDLKRHCTARLARGWVPGLLMPVTEPLPRTGTGKVDRRMIAQTVAAPAATAS